MAEEQKVEAVAAAPKKKPLLLIAIVVLVVTLATGGGMYFFIGGKSDTAEANEQGKGGEKKKKGKEAPKLPAQYVKLDPPFVVNFEAKGLMRFLQVTVEVMTRDPVTAEIITKNDPMIRNDLIMLFGNQQYESISTREGKDKLRAEALATVSKVIDAEGGEGKKVEQLFFTSFVMQ
jgi:flagellar protein FliL